MAFYQILILFLDITCNLAVESIIGHSASILVFFLIQTCGLVINLISYVIGFASQTMQSGVTNSVTQLHGLNLLTIVSYTCVTLWWYIWNIQRSWPTVGDQFNFDFNNSEMMTRNQTQLISGDKMNDSSHVHELDGREYSTVWSPGFIALYTIQRTAAILYYMVFIRNASISSASYNNSRRNTEVQFQLTPEFEAQVRNFGEAMKRST